MKKRSVQPGGVIIKASGTTKHAHKRMTAKQYAAYLKYIQKHFPNRGKRRRAKKAAKTSRSRTLTLNGGSVKLGRNAPYAKAEKPRLVLDGYFRGSLPKAHSIVNWASHVPEWPMFLNDEIGDCTIAAAAHAVQAWTTYASTEQALTDQEVLTAYEAVSGYNPVTGANDNGAVEQDVLAYWRKTGIGGHKIAAFGQLENLDNLTMAKQATDIFGTLYIGLNVPDTAMDQFNEGLAWTVVPGAQIEGGHAVPVQYWGTDENAEIGVVTWARLQKMTTAFWREYVEEAWVIITPDWLEANGDTVEGFDLAQLEADFKALTGETLR